MTATTTLVSRYALPPAEIEERSVDLIRRALGPALPAGPPGRGVCRVVHARAVRPRLVIGTPVGFVAAAESKAALEERDVPFVTVAGTRGGSAIAAAAVNALLRLACPASRGGGKEAELG